MASQASEIAYPERAGWPQGAWGHALWRVAAREMPNLWRIELKNSAPVQMKASVTLRFCGEPGATVCERDVQYRYGRPWFALLDALLLRRRNKLEGHNGLLRAKQILEESAAHNSD